MSTLPRANCRGCGRSIVWAKGPNGNIPLDATAPTYFVTVEDGVVRAEPTKERATVMVTHFSTCPKAASFSKGRKT